MPTRLLIPSTALLWGLQFAFLNPALALLLTTLFDAFTTEVGWSLALYNASALVATTVTPPARTAPASTCGRCWSVRG